MARRTRRVETRKLTRKYSFMHTKGDMPEKVIKTDEEWQRILTSEQYKITQKKGTELLFTGKYYHFKEKDIYHCVRCGNELFSSETKYDSGSGWPSFWTPTSDQSIETAVDTIQGMTRTEVMCRRCNSHLGHVFDDGPPRLGCVTASTQPRLNSSAMRRNERQRDEEGGSDISDRIW